MPEGFNSDVIRYCEIRKKLTSWREKAPICKGTVKGRWWCIGCS